MGKISINIKEGKIKKNDTIVGIDLGTTHSLISFIDPDKKEPVIIQTDKNLLVPSIIHFTENGDIIVGDTAKKALLHKPENTIFSVKRLLGKSYKDLDTHKKDYSYRIIDDEEDKMVKVAVSGKYYSPIELSAMILSELKTRAESVLNQSINKAVITVPAYFNDSQRQATRDAGKLAGLEVLRIINEPTAASLAYGLGENFKELKTVLVYDFGGGTFDVSILSIEGGVFEVLSTHGDTFLGGDDISYAIQDYWKQIYSLSLSKETDNQRLRFAAEDAKIALSKSQQFKTTLSFDQGPVHLDLDFKTYSKLAKPSIDKTMISLKKALQDSGKTPEAIDHVVLVGGSTKSLVVQNELCKVFPEHKMNNTINPDEIVALGAAIEADILAGNRSDTLLLDVTPLSLGIETLGGLMDVIIPRNTKIPSGAAREYTTSKDGQVNIKINVYQGERELVEQNRKLAEFTLSGIPAMPAGLAKIEVKFVLDADGILQVKATELRSNVSQDIEVKPQYGLTDKQVEDMLLESLKNAKPDMDHRLSVEVQTEAEQMIYLTEQFLSKHGEVVNTEELEKTIGYVNQLKETIKNKDRHTITQHIETLNEFTKPFAERAMNRAVSASLKGKKI